MKKSRRKTSLNKPERIRYRETKTIICRDCGIEEAANNFGKKFCKKCRQIHNDKIRARQIIKEKKDRFLIFERDGFRCCYCGRSSVEEKLRLVIDHVKPRVKGGSDTAGNLITSCHQCNSAKLDKILDFYVLKRIELEISERNREFGIFDEQEIKNGE